MRRPAGVPSTTVTRAMDLSQLRMFSLLGQRMGWNTQRQSVLAENIANADTPGFQPQDLQSFHAHVERAAPPRLGAALTHTAHLAGGGSGVEARSDRIRDVYEVSPSGNAVILEQQLLAVTETAMNHQLALNLFSKHLSMMKTALGRGGR